MHESELGPENQINDFDASAFFCTSKDQAGWDILTFSVSIINISTLENGGKAHAAKHRFERLYPCAVE